MNDPNQHINTDKKYLYLLWVLGMFLFIYLCIPFVNKDSGMYLPDVLLSVKSQNSELRNKKKLTDYDTRNEALVFVTINKKKLLTKFVTYLSDEDLRKEQLNDTLIDTNEKNVIIIGKKKNTKQSRKKEDFSIKHAPEI